MRNACLVLFYFSFLPHLSWSQLFPTDSAIVNYRIIGFTFPATAKADNYKVEICSGDYTGKDFDQHISNTLKSKSNRIIGKVPAFNQAYSWRVIAYQNSKELVSCKVHHFSTGTTSFIDTTANRMSVLHKADIFKDGYVFADATRALYNMNGEPVWYLPHIEGVKSDSATVRDLKLSCKGTITLMLEGDVYEIDYNGKVLWRGPNGRKIKTDTLQGYHHEITRLANGHYLTLGFDPIPKRPVPINRDSIMRIRQADTSKNKIARIQLRKPRYGVLMEYDDKENLVWKWEAAKYFGSIDLSAYPESAQNDVHENSFYFDEQNSIIYLSFRNLSQILKISYPSGKVLSTYSGTLPSPGDNASNLFCGQHAIRHSEHGYLYMFDNGCNPTEAPKVIRCKEPAKDSAQLSETWEFPCPVATHDVHTSRTKQPATSGGNAIELPDQSMFISTCIPNSNIYIVSMTKQILWEAAIEKLNLASHTWQYVPLYRASIITESDKLDDLIWNSQNH